MAELLILPAASARMSQVTWPHLRMPRDPFVKKTISVLMCLGGQVNAHLAEVGVVTRVAELSVAQPRGYSNTL